MTNKVLDELFNNIVNYLKSDYSISTDFAYAQLNDENYFTRLLNDSNIFTKEHRKFLWKVLDRIETVDCISNVRNLFDLYRNNEVPQQSNELRSGYVPVRDKDNKIVSYRFKVKTRKFDFSGEVSREELEEWVANYSLRGAGQTASEVCLKTCWNTDQFKAILRAFGIFKSTPYTLHEAEENTLEELSNKLLNRKEIKVIKNAERRAARDIEDRYNKLLEENQKLKTFNSLAENALSNVPVINIDKKYNDYQSDRKDLILWLSDWHIGARVDDPTNPNWYFGYDEFMDRIYKTINNIPKENYDNVVIAVMGDMIDGFNGQTTRGGHTLPQNMGDDDQLATYTNGIKEIIEYVLNRINHNFLKLITVKGGNHDGFALGYLTYEIFNQYAAGDTISAELIDSPMFGHFVLGDHTYVLSHGKDPYYCKKGLSLNVTEKDRSTYLNYLIKNNIDPNSTNVHFVKGDLHQDNFQQIGAHIDVRTVASLFGASDYSDYNFSDSDAGTSYEIIRGRNVERGMIKI